MWHFSFLVWISLFMDTVSICNMYFFSITIFLLTFSFLEPHPSLNYPAPLALILRLLEGVSILIYGFYTLSNVFFRDFRNGNKAHSACLTLNCWGCKMWCWRWCWPPYFLPCGVVCTVQQKMKHKPRGARTQTTQVRGSSCSQVWCQVSVLELCKPLYYPDLPFWIKLVHIGFLSHATKQFLTNAVTLTAALYELFN